MGDVVVHFGKDGQPVYIEVLNARAFLSTAKRVVTPAARHRRRIPA
ncbi:DUF2283 domain-containing protein [Candidatus Uhrbacteria bacterium]|nr:DUF2283 domain-containing protein [Candidatus Uhrbacteria bacterium]